MKNNKKCLSVLSTAAMGTLIATALTSGVSAKTTDVIATINAQNVKFGFSDLNTSYEDKVLGVEAPLYDTFATNTGIVSLLDDKTGYVDYKAVANAAEDAAVTGANFALDTFTEAAKGDQILSNVKVDAEWKDGAVTPVDQTLKVEGVNATNLKAVTVSFTKAVDKTTLTTDTVKAYVNASSTAATYTQGLSADGKTLTLAFNGINQSDSVKLVLDGVKDADGKAMEKYEKAVTMNDVDAPLINDAKVVNNKKIDILFSEPVNMDTAGVFKTTDASSTGLLKIDGNLTFAKYTTVPTENKVTVELFSELADGSHTVDLSEVKDFAGFKVVAKSFTINTVKDVTAPKATAVKYTSATTAEVTFDEDLKAPLTGTFEVYEAGNATNKFASAAFKVNAGTTDYKTVVLTTSPFTVAATVGFDVKYKNVEDVFGNKTTEYTTISGKADDNTTKPSIASYVVEAQNAIKVVFSQKVNAPTAANFAMYKEDGTTAVTGTFAVADYDTTNPDGKTFKVTFTGLNQVDAAVYKLKVTGVTDQSIRVNKMDDAVLTIGAKDTKQPTLLTAKATEDTTTANNDKVDLIFSEAMDAATAGNIANYFVGTTPANTITGAKVDSVSADGKKVVLIIPGLFNDSHALAYTTIAMPTLKDLAGNLVSNATISNSASISTGYVALATTDIEYVKATSTNTVLVKIKDASNYTFSSADAKAIKIFANGADANLGVIGAQISQDGKTLTVTTGAPMGGDAKVSGAALTLNIASVDSEAVKDQNGTAVTLSLGIADKIAPAVSTATYKINDNDAVALTKSADGATLTADISKMTSTDKVKIDTITLTEAGAKMRLLTPFINTIVNGQYNDTATVITQFNSVAGADGLSLEKLQAMAKYDADGDDNTLTITGRISDDANGNGTFEEADIDNVTFVTIKVKVK